LFEQFCFPLSVAIPYFVFPALALEFCRVPPFDLPLPRFFHFLGIVRIRLLLPKCALKNNCWPFHLRFLAQPFTPSLFAPMCPFGCPSTLCSFTDFLASGSPLPRRTKQFQFVSSIGPRGCLCFRFLARRFFLFFRPKFPF